MKITIDYSGQSPEDKAKKALADIHGYLDERYAKAEEIVKTLDVKSFGVACGFLGIEGYPVSAWFDHFNGPGAYDAAWDAIEASKD